MLAVSNSAISVENVQPLYGPVAGGTRVTITGRYVSVSTVTDVYFGQHRGFVDKHRSAFCISYILVLLFGCYLANTLPSSPSKVDRIM